MNLARSIRHNALKILLVTSSLFAANMVSATEIKIDLEVPNIHANPYHKPYIAVWIETPKRKGVHTLAFWKEQPDWFKDLRQWWRKIGRSNTPNYDAVTGATRKPGVYQLIWDTRLASGEKLEPGNYVLHFESVREQGSREYLRQRFTVGSKLSQHYELQGKSELGKIIISIKNESP